MLSKVLAVVTSVFLVILQLSLTPMFKIGWINYNLALVCIIVVCCLCDSKTAIINAVSISLIYDSFAARTPGIYIVMYIIIACAVLFISKRMFNRNFKASLVFTFVATLLTELIVYWVFYAFRGMSYNSFVLSKIILPQCAINSVICLGVFWFYKSVLKIRRS